MADTFLQLSARLTGFNELDLLATGVRDTYWKTLQTQVSPSIAQSLLTVGDSALQSSDPDSALRQDVLNDQQLGPVARNLILLWYLGSWQPMPLWWIQTYGVNASSASPFVVSVQSYQEGLVWPAIGAHPRGAKAPGFGSWALPPQSPGDGHA